MYGCKDFVVEHLEEKSCKISKVHTSVSSLNKKHPRFMLIMWILYELIYLTSYQAGFSNWVIKQNSLKGEYAEIAYEFV